MGVWSGASVTVMLEANKYCGGTHPSVFGGTLIVKLATVRVSLAPGGGLKFEARKPAATQAARAPATDRLTTVGAFRQLLAGGGGGGAGGPVGQSARQP